MEMSKIGKAAMLSALKTVRIEQDALATLAVALRQSELRDAFLEAIAAIDATKGRLIVTGMGKSGIVARKIAATMTSTGTPSLYIHPGEASHGDLGMITPDDIVLALTWSGETSELSDIIAFCRRFGAKLIVVTSQRDSSAGRAPPISASPSLRCARPAPTSSPRPRRRRSRSCSATRSR